MDNTSLPTINVEPCRGCGACCQGRVIPPFDLGDDNDTEFKALPLELQEEVNAFWASNCDEQGHLRALPPCVWWDARTGRCRQYEHRPRVCREFVPGEGACLDFRQEHGHFLPPIIELAEVQL